MSKYAPLQQYLQGKRATQSSLRMSFAEIGNLGIDLPKSAYDHRAWWANDRTTEHRPMRDAWLDAGWETEDVDMQGQTLTFRKIR